ncbi:MAG: MarR family winged helix-turn-helix transcriptional regulator [Solirubrobacteraceae bacterium]
MRPTQTPIGLELARTARAASRAFDAELAEAGGSLPVWLVLLGVKAGHAVNQRALAESVGVTEATLTHHLNAMERDGLLTRARHETNRRVHVVTLTDAGEAAFVRLREAASKFDRRLRRGIPDGELDTLRRTLERLMANAETQVSSRS